jgi:DNA-binding LacI/PurR family transcriptional regulator
MGRRAVKLLLERMLGGPDAEPIEIVLRPQLIVRGTTGPLRVAVTQPVGSES